MEQKKATSFYIDYATTEKAEMPKMAMPAKIIEKMQARLTKTKTAVMERREKLKANPPKPMYSVREPQKLRKRKSGADIHHETKRSRSSVDFEEEEKVQVQTTKDTEQKLEAGDAPVNPTAAN